MKLSTQAIRDLKAGLEALDGQERAVKDGERQRIVREPYKLGSGLRLAVAKNIARCREPVEAYWTARNALVVEIANGTADASGALPPSRMGEFVRRDAELLEAEHEIDLVVLKSDELRLDDNPIPGSVLAALAPVIDGFGGEQ